MIRRQSLLLILLAAFAGRAVAAVALQRSLDRRPGQSFLIEGDANGYWELGGQLAAGKPYQIYHPPRRVLRMPGFPAFLAIARILAGNSFLLARILQAAVGTAGCWLTYLLGRELFSRHVGLWAAAISAVLPTFVGFSVVLLSETLFATALLASLWTMCRLIRLGFGPEHRRRAVGWSLAVGAACAAATFVRPSWLLCGPLFVVMYFALSRHKRQTAVRGVLVIGALFLLLLPWAWRNRQVTGHWVFTTLWVGASLYDGLNPDATGSSDMTFFDHDHLMTRMSEYDVDRYYRARAWNFVRMHPVRTLKLAAIKLGRYWKPWPNAAPFQSAPLRLAVAVPFVVLLLLSVRGGWLYCDRFAALALTAGPILYFAAVHAVFIGSLRYRLPAEYPLCVLAAAGIVGRSPESEGSDASVERFRDAERNRR